MVQAVLQHVWVGGHDASDPVRLAALREQLAPARDPDGAEVKAELRALTDAAVADGVFGVPTCTLDGRQRDRQRRLALRQRHAARGFSSGGSLLDP